MKITLRFLLLIIAGCYIINQYFISVEYFGGNCPTNSGAGSVCHQLAAAQCRIPTYQSNDCWLNTYSECKRNCSGGGSSVCDCDAYASNKCKSSTSPADGCYTSVLQKCMAGMGFGPDPDRGAPSI